MNKDLALETLKSFVENTDNVIAKDAILALHPELAESEDERIRKAIKLILIATEEDQDIFYRTHNLTRKECTDWLEKQKEQKLAEWSEEDEEMIEHIIRVLEGAGNLKKYPYSVEINWLKSLRPQPKTSTLPVVRTKEIDEQMFNDIIARFNGMHYKYEMLQAMKSWLIELRERLRWKPSEEQMTALKLAYEDAFECPESCVPHLPLESLYNNLKKL